MSTLGLVASALIGIALGFFGGGGSILTVPLFVYVFGQGPKQAIASSLVVVGLASLAGAWQHGRAGHVELRTALFFGSTGLVGAYLGARAAAHVDGALLLLLFAGMMILTALAMWRGRPAEARSAAPPASSPPGVPERSRVRLAAQGFGVGMLTGLVGAGGGFLIVPALALWAGLPMATAVGTSLVIIVLNAFAGFLGHATNTELDYSLVAAVSAAAIAGSFVGARLGQRIAPGRIRRVFASFVLVVAVFVLVRETDTWLGTARTALPSSVPQLVFVVLALGVGVAMGRVSRRAGADLIDDRMYSDGGGI